MQMPHNMRCTHTDRHTLFTCDFESCLAVRQLQSKQPSKQLSYWCDRHQSPAHWLGYLTNQNQRYNKLVIVDFYISCKHKCGHFSDSYLADGSVCSPISHHNVGMEINVVQLHWSGSYSQGTAHFTTNTLGGTWRSGQGLHKKPPQCCIMK